MPRPKYLLIALILTFPASAFAQQHADQIDPVAASPDMYRVLLENEHVRVVQYEIRPGESDGWHTHPAKTSYVSSGGTLRITTADGTSFVVEEESGAAAWLDAIGKHYGENIGDSIVRIILVEIKSISVAS